MNCVVGPRSQCKEKEVCASPFEIYTQKTRTEDGGEVLREEIYKH